MANVNDEKEIGNEIGISVIREEMYRMVALSVDKHPDFLYRLMLDEDGEVNIVCLPAWSSNNICADCLKPECCCRIEKICLHSVQGSDYEEIDREDGTDSEDIAEDMAEDIAVAFVDNFIDVDEIFKMARTFLAGEKKVFFVNSGGCLIYYYFANTAAEAANMYFDFSSFDPPEPTDIDVYVSWLEDDREQYAKFNFEIYPDQAIG